MISKFEKAVYDMISGIGSIALFIIGLLITLITGGYLLPFAVALFRGNNLGKVFFINLFLGWTLIGWFLALFFAFFDETKNSTCN